MAATTHPTTSTDAALRVSVSDTDNGGTIVALGGALVAYEAEWSRAVLEELVDRGSGPILFDCSRLQHADCGGLATLYRSLRRARNRGRDWRLRGITGQPLLALRASGFDELLPTA